MSWGSRDHGRARGEEESELGLHLDGSRWSEDWALLVVVVVSRDTNAG